MCAPDAGKNSPEDRSQLTTVPSPNSSIIERTIPMAGDTEHPGILYFYSESIALASNGCCAFVAALSNLGVIERGLASIGLWYLVIGGVVQLLCALRAYRAYDHFGGTSFAFYSAFWALLGLEIIQSTNIHLLHINLLYVGILLAAVSPIVNGYYPVLLTSIAVASSLELARRVSNDDNNTGAIEMAAAVSELCVVVTTAYGCVAAILHGIYERQVLPGLDDAIIETVLLKRNALKSLYSEGKYGNPTPLGCICCSLGYAGLAFQSHSSSEPSSLTIWFATIAVLCGLVSLLHNLRHEKIWVIDAVINACLFACLATVSGGRETGGVMLAFSVVRLFLLGFAVVEELALMHILNFIIQPCTLLIMGVASYFMDGNNPNVYWAYIVGYLTSLSSIYKGVAELANSVAQKELLPIGQGWKYKAKDVNNTETDDEEFGNLTRPNSQSASRPNRIIRLLSMDTSTHNNSSKDSRLVRGVSTLARSLEDYANNNTDGNDNEVLYPGDHKLLGKSDFQSPLFLMTMGTGIYSIVMSIGVMMNSSAVILDSALILLVSQLASLLVCISRGHTSYGFLCFTNLMEGLILMGDYYSGSEGGATSLLGIVLVLQLIWLSASFRLFRLLSFATVAHVFGLLFYSLFEINQHMNGLRYAAATFFVITFLLNMATLGLLLGSSSSIFCRWLLQSSAADTEDLCEMGFASNRNEFDRCVEILKEGGVCCIPTDTVYCLACRANSPEAIQRIYAIKNRPSEKPLSLWLGSIDDIRSVSPSGVGWTPKLFAFMESMWPGSVSLVVSRGAWLQRMGVGVAADLIGTEDSIALRVPNSTLTVALLKETGPLAITSANPSGACDCTHHNKVSDSIASKIDYILADGPSPMTIASSVIDVRNIDTNELLFYRVGCVPEAYVYKKLHDLKEKSPPMLADIHNTKFNTIQSFMSQIIRLVGCETYKIHMLIDTSSSDNSDIETCCFDEIGPRIRSAFLSTVSHYGTDTEDAEASEMIAPLLNSQGEVIAVLQLLNKSSNDGFPNQFNKEDLQYSTLVSALLSGGDNLPTKKADTLEWTETVAVVSLTEHGFKNKPKVRPALPNQATMKSFRNLHSTSRRNTMKSMRNLMSMRRM